MRVGGEVTMSKVIVRFSLKVERAAYRPALGIVTKWGESQTRLFDLPSTPAGHAQDEHKQVDEVEVQPQCADETDPAFQLGVTG